MTSQHEPEEPQLVWRDSDEQRRRRMEAVERMASMNIEDVPDPDELSRQLNNKYDWSWMYDDEEEA
jgi:hypothetical protein